MKLHSSLYSLFILALWAMAITACDNAHGENQTVNQPEPKAQPETAEPAEQVAEPEDDFDFTISYLMGQFDPATHPDFVKVDDKYTDGDGVSHPEKFRDLARATVLFNTADELLGVLKRLDGAGLQVAQRDAVL